MEAIKIYLDKFVRLDQSYQQLKTQLINTIKQHTGADLTDKDFRLRGSVVYIHSHPIIRGEIYLKQTLIIADMQARPGGGQRITKIV